MDTDSAKTQVADVVEAARDATRDQAEQAVEKGRGVVRSQVENRSTQMGRQAQSLAGTLRQTATHLRESGDSEKLRFADVAEQGADRLERSGRYLAESDADELLSWVEDVARRQPWLMAGAGLLAGIAAARFLKASSADRYQRQTMPITTSVPAASPPRGARVMDDPLAMPAPAVRVGP